MNTLATHPLVLAYLQELERLLAGIDPGERAEVMAGVREHLDGALAGRDQVSDEEVRGVLAELGPPQAIADEAYAGRTAHASIPPGRVGALSRPWVPVVVAVLTAVGLFLVILVAGTSSGVITSSSVDSSGNVVETSELSGDVPWAPLFGALLLALPLWGSVAILVGVSPLWVGREKLMAALLIPVAAALNAFLPMLGFGLVGVNGVYAGAWTALALIVVGGGWLLMRLTRRASARAADATSATP